MIGKERLLETIQVATPGTYILPAADQRGDGFDIACADHEDNFDELVEAAHQRGGLMTRIYANGFFCAYKLVIPAQDIYYVLAQHSGSWGPWYHVSAYRIKNERLVYDHHIGGHYKLRHAPDYPTLSELRDRLRADGTIK